MLLQLSIISMCLVGSALSECDTTGLAACSDHNAVVSKLAEWAAVNNVTGAGFTGTLLNSTCELFPKYVACANNLTTDTCGEDTYLYHVKLIHSEYCNKMEWTCKVNVIDCYAREPALAAEWTKVEEDPNSDLPPDTFCPANERMMACLRNMDHRCRSFETDATITQFATNVFYRHCREKSCAPLQTCINTFNSAGPSLTPFNNQTCYLWHDMVRCSGGAVSSCTNIKPDDPRNPSMTDIASVVAQSCSIVNSLYSCEAFQQCVQTILPFNPLTPNSFCLVSQIMMGCTSGLATACGVANANSIIQQTNALALRTAGMGCGNPYLYVENCQPIKTCVAPLNTVMAKEGHTFMERCTAIKNFQTCASTSAAGCNLALPADAKYPKPEMSVLAGITTRVCNTLSGQAIADATTCPKFSSCVDGYLTQYNINIMPLQDGERVVGKAWCGIMTRVMECAMFYKDQCPFSAQVNASLMSAYSDLIDAGCPDPYAYKARTGTDPSGGAQSTFTVSFFALVASSLLGRLL